MVIQRETKCVQNKQKLNGQFMKKKYNKKNTRKMKGKIQEKGKKRAIYIAQLQRGENSTELCPTGFTSKLGY